MLLKNKVGYKVGGNDAHRLKGLEYRDEKALSGHAYNYPSIDELQKMDEESKMLLLPYYRNLKNLYSGSKEQHHVSKKANDILFNVDRWNIFSDYIPRFQLYIRNYFTGGLNAHIRNNYNSYILDADKDINNRIKGFGKNYKNNININGERAFAPVDKSRLITEFENVIDITEKTLKSENRYVEVRRDLDTNTTSHIIKLR